MASQHEFSINRIRAYLMNVRVRFVRLAFAVAIHINAVKCEHVHRIAAQVPNLVQRRAGTFKTRRVGIEIRLESELRYIGESPAAAAAFAENYVGLRFR